MLKPLKDVVPVLLVCFVFTFILPSLPARADEVKAIDNEHVTYTLDTHGDVRAGQNFTLSVSAKYDGIPITDLSIVNLKGFQLINAKGNGEFEMQTPSEGDKSYGLQMEGTANGQKVDFTAFVKVLNKNQQGTGENVGCLVIGILGGVAILTLLIVAMANAG